MIITEMTALLARHSARAVPLFRDGEQAPYGFTLRGPRGNKNFVSVDAAGGVDTFTVQLWLDGIAYGDRRAPRMRQKRNSEETPDSPAGA